MPRTVVFYSLIAAIVFIFIPAITSLPYSHNLFLVNNIMSTSTSDSPAKGWHSRATLYPQPFTPDRSSLQVAILRNAPADPSGFTLALFQSQGGSSPPSTIAVDAAGKVLLVSNPDFDALVTLAERISTDLPSTGSFRNTWVISQRFTSQPIERILFPVRSPSDPGGMELQFKETSVQGYDGVSTRLKKPVGEYHDLPSTLQVFMELVLEAREGLDGGEKDEKMIGLVKDILGDAV